MRGHCLHRSADSSAQPPLSVGILSNATPSSAFECALLAPQAADTKRSGAEFVTSFSERLNAVTMPPMLERLTDIDNAILHAIHDAFQSPAMDTTMTFVTSLGDMAFVWFVVAGLLLCKKEYRFYGGIVIIAIMCAYLVGELGLKNIIGRDRPFLADPTLATQLIALPESFSFPSGHTGSSFAAATALCFLPMRHTWYKAIPLAGAACVAFSRLYLGVHYPTDVLAGMALGIASGIAAVYIARYFVRRKKKANRPEEDTF